MNFEAPNPQLRLSVSPKDIQKKAFSTDKPGYDPSQVDGLLDRIAKDYETFKAVGKSLTEGMDEKDRLIARARNQVAVLERTQKELSQKALAYDRATGDNPQGLKDSVALLARIAKLEAALAEAGVDPSIIK